MSLTTLCVILCLISLVVVVFAISSRLSVGFHPLTGSAPQWGWGIPFGILALVLILYIGWREGSLSIPTQEDFTTKNVEPDWITAGRANGKKVSFNQVTKMWAMEWIPSKGPTEEGDDTKVQTRDWKSLFLVGRSEPMFWSGKESCSSKKQTVLLIKKSARQNEKDKLIAGVDSDYAASAAEDASSESSSGFLPVVGGSTGR